MEDQKSTTTPTTSPREKMDHDEETVMLSLMPLQEKLNYLAAKLQAEVAKNEAESWRRLKEKDPEAWAKYMADKCANQGNESRLQ